MLLGFHNSLTKDGPCHSPQYECKKVKLTNPMAIDAYRKTYFNLPLYRLSTIVGAVTPFGWSLSITKTVVIPSAEDSLWHSYFCNEDVFIAVMDWNENTKTDRHIGRSILTK
ncbi:hypothetical protein EMCRGX_G016349 [Ephydatia muelleri]